MTESIPRPPKSLGAAGRRLWRQMLADWDLSEDSRVMLTQACHCTDACERLQEIAADEPPMIKGRLGQQLPNPVYAELRAERRLLLALLLALREPAADDAGYPGGLRVVR